ncbi:MAG TPA: hypothetical protein VL096_07770 [Pirellulaceae bacterium]|nr:hypothetical protein [Pirellulaceae bacterium]
MTALGCDANPGLPVQTAQSVTTPASPAPATTEPTATTPPVTTPVAPPTETVKAAPGVTGKGTSYGGGIITEPASQYFKLREKAVFDIQIPSALKLYKASNDNKAPQSHDDFWREIVVANGLEGRMPRLPPGHKYVWNVEKEELQVERPAPQ